VQVWTVANQKGGVAKTTSVVTLGGILASRGNRVLLLDLDPHGSLSSYFSYDPDTLTRSSLNLFTEDRPSLDFLKSLIVPTTADKLSLLPASMSLATVERSASSNGMGLKVSRALALLNSEFDFVLIDSPPVLGALMINALAACDQLLVPVQTEYLAMKGAERMMRTIAMVERSLNKPLHYTLVATMFDRRTQASNTTLRALRQTYPDHIWPSMIPVDTRFRDASKSGQVPSTYAPGSRGVRAYQSLLKSLIFQQDQRLMA
jgi:chromosome partitioning protein